MERKGLLLELRYLFRSNAAGVLNALGLDYNGRELVSTVGKGEERSNYEVVIRLMQRTLNERLEAPTREGRRDWDHDDLRKALDLLDDVRGFTIHAIEDAVPIIKLSRRSP